MKKKYKNGIAKLGRQRYEVLVTRCDPRQDGKRVSRRRVVDGSRYEAEAAKRQLKAELEAELAGAARPKLTLGDYALQWLEARSAGLKPSTRAKYVNDLERHILPALGHMRLAEIRPRDIAAFLARDAGAPNSQKNRLALLRVLAKDALADDLVDRDFCLRVSVKVPPVYTEAEPNMLRDANLDPIIANIPQYWLDACCALAFTGLRWGEVSALHWPELDFERKEATVKWSNWRGILGAPKSDKGYRTVPLAGPLPEILQERKRRMIAERHPGLRRGLVFPTKQGTPHKGTPLHPVLKKACKAAGIEIRFTPHGLRRTWNNIARRIASGQVVRAIIGHASEAMTDHYSLIERDEKHMTAEGVAAVLQRSKGEQEPPASDIDRGAATDNQDSPDGRLVDETVDDGTAPPPSTGPKPK